MSRPAHWTLNTLTALSIGLIVVIAGLWVTSYGTDLTTTVAEWHFGFARGSVVWSPTHSDISGIEGDIPYRPTGLITTWLGGMLLYLFQTIRRRLIGEAHPDGLCPARGYDLRATPHRCPECGRPADATAARAV